MKIPTTNKVKRIYWQKAKGKLFSSEKGSFDKSKDSIPLRVEKIKEKDNLIVAKIYFDGSVYEALNYGFQEPEFNINVPEQLGNFLEALEAEWPHLFFEPYNNSIIDVAINQ